MPPALLATLLLNSSLLSHAAQPDAGAVLRDELRRDQAPRLTMPPSLEAIDRSPIVDDSGAKLAVASFHIVGLSGVPEAEAQAFLASYVGQSLSVEGLHRVAERFEQWLRAKGLFVARAYVPAQAIKDGVVEIRVLEGRLEDIEIRRAPDTRLREDILRDTVATALPPGQALDQSRLERGLLLLNDLPVLSARAVLAPGKELGGTRLIVEAAQGPVVSGTAELDNTGNRFTGEWRLGASVAINDAGGRGDQWTLRATASEGSRFLRGGYSLPLGSEGWRLAIGLMASRYDLCCESSIGALDANGRASAFTAGVSFPVWRSRLKNLSLSASASERDFLNRALGTTTSDKRSRSLILAANGDWTDAGSGLGAYGSYAVNWTGGHMNLDAWAADKAADAASANSAGSFGKLQAQVSYLMRIFPSAAVFAGINGQIANKNLDSSEKFVLGGPQGVRAYPTGEASGDEGWLLNLEWRQELSSAMRIVGFVDHGQITQHHHAWANWDAAMPTVSNRYALSGAGVSLVWSPEPRMQLSATLAQRLGKNPALDADGRDSDSRTARTLLWVQGTLTY